MPVGAGRPVARQIADLTIEYDYGIMTIDMKTMGAGEFKAKCLSLMDEVKATGEEITITKRGKPVARLVPPRPKADHRIMGCREGSLEIIGDIVAPVGEKWDVES